MIRLGRLFFKYRDLTVPLVFVALAAAIRPDIYPGHEHLNLILNIVGLSIVAFGQSLRAAVIGFAYIRRGGKDKRVYADTLQQGGLFAHCRNPLYVGNILMLVGLSLVHGDARFSAIAIAFALLVYISLIAAEEDFLSRKFGGEYTDYCRRVPRFAFRVRGLRRSLQGIHYDWGRLIRKEYGTMFTSASAALALLAWESIAWRGYEASRHEITILLSIWAVVFLGWIVARLLKKRTNLLRAM